MPKNEPITETLDYIRASNLFAWTFALSIANLTVQIYRFVATLTTFMFDIFKLSYGVDLFWPLTTDDLRPYTHYISNQNETLYKLLELFILCMGAFFGASSLLKYSVFGLILFTLLFLIHTAIAIIGLTFFAGK